MQEVCKQRGDLLGYAAALLKPIESASSTEA
jgi:hypothetical protein